MLQGFAWACKLRISKPNSFLFLALCCTVLRSRWYQSGIKRPRAIDRFWHYRTGAMQDRGYKLPRRPLSTGSSDWTGRKAFISTGNVSPPTRCLSTDRIHSASLFGLCPEVLRVYGCLLLRAGVPHLLASEQAQQCLLYLSREREGTAVPRCAGKVGRHGLLCG